MSPQGYRKPGKRNEAKKEVVEASEESEKSESTSPPSETNGATYFSPRTGTAFKPLKVESQPDPEGSKEVTPIEIVVGDKTSRAQSRAFLPSPSEVEETVRYENMSQEEKRAHLKKILAAKQGERKKARLTMSDDTNELMDELHELMGRYIDRMENKEKDDKKMKEFVDQIAEIRNYTVTETARMENLKRVNGDLEKELSDKKAQVYGLLIRAQILQHEIEKRQKFKEYVVEEGHIVVENFYSALLERRPLGDIVGAVVIKPYDYKPPLNEKTAQDVHIEDDTRMSPELAEIFGIDLDKTTRLYSGAQARPRKAGELPSSAPEISHKTSWYIANVPNAPQDLRVQLSPRDTTWTPEEKSLKVERNEKERGNSLSDKDGRERTRSLNPFKKGKRDKDKDEDRDSKDGKDKEKRDKDGKKK